MAQLTNDCFAFGDAPLTIDEALAFIRERVPAVGERELLPLGQCDGRVLAEDLRALSPLPAFFNAAVDGYAVRHSDLSQDAISRLPVAGRLQAGATMVPPLPARSAFRIFTGAPMPEGADTIFMQEDVELAGADVVLPPGLKRGANCRPAGEELDAGALAIAARTRLAPQHLALAAGVGVASLKVRKRVRVAIFSTGDELTEPGAARTGAQVHDTNRVMLAALLARAGCAVSDLGILRDEPDSLRAALRKAAAGHDLILTSGGVSTGEADYVKLAVEAEGRLDHWRFAIKPGRPLAMGVIGGAAFAGLPGNPVAVFVTFTQVVRAVIAALAGENWQPPRFLPVRAGFRYRKKRGRIEFLRVSLTDGAAGPIAARYPIEGAGIISSLTGTDGLVRLSFDCEGVSEGDRLDYLPFAAMLG
ncbi:MAG: molybdopterin molybdotransferase MoeA [Methylocystis sp.]|nr:molybdopterin molybdotransferase MoeA [Methylocystis sp.]MCA3585980.1 molybdopterin molybdotransferase MoeA [Methylocystis sp.]MCA3587363.1 molybdopterin molybdotransferase MoeA [Methylocystis sp.]MCA3592921.1 molybdopterin molybdotransferase MoeA [Methylocystis sp.]